MIDKVRKYRNSIIVSFIISLIFSLNIQIICAAENDLFQETDQHDNLRLGNDYIVIVSNMDDNGRGRFAIETTGGAPMHSNDINKPLIYGRPKPWTSYTTIWIDGEYYVFGGETGRRAGRSGRYGEVIEGPYVEDGSIYTSTQLNDNIVVEQILTIVKSSTTGLYDSVQIKYRIHNNDEERKKIGIRLMLDTMLGENDGAPIRIGDKAVTTDTLFYKKQLPEFYQAFDSISEPKVTSQGTFIAPDVTPPDEVKLADWGSMADGVWDFDFNPGEEFIRKGEYEIDSAIAMYWVPEFLEPGETITYITKYGLGGITVVPGLLSLGVTSPAEFVLDKPEKTFPVIAYIENTSEITAENVNVNLNIPEWLAVEEKVKSIGDLESGEIAQVQWDVGSDGIVQSNTEYQVEVIADNTDSNQVKRTINFVGPPEINAEMYLNEDLSVLNGELVPNPFDMNLNIENIGGSALYDVSAEIILPPGLVFAEKEKNLRYLKDIEAGINFNLRWKIKALNVMGQFPVAVEITALNDYSEIIRFEDLDIPELDSILFIETEEENNINTGDYITVNVRAANITELEHIDTSLRYDPDYLEPIYVSRGNLFLRDNNFLPWNKPDLSEAGYIKFQSDIPGDKASGTLFSLHFKVLKDGRHSLNWQEGRFFDNGREVNVSLENYLFN